jgi:basic membrane protein A
VGAVALFAWIIADYRGDGSDGDGTGNAAAGENVSEGAEDGADSGGDGAATTGDCGRGKVICVGLVTGQGSIEDGAFNQAAWEGLQQVELDTGAVVEYWESYDPADVQTGIERFIGDGFDIVVTVGFLAADITAQTAVDYPDVYFIGVEQRHDDASTNLVGLVFPEDQAGYLAGAIAGRVTRTGVVGQVLGPEEVEPIRAFGTGFENGVASVDPGHQVLSTHHPGPLDVGFVDPDFGAEVVAAYHHHDGVDVVFAAAGMTGDGALTEMALEAESGEDVWCIGVDVDQWETLPEAQPCLVTSAVKNITDGLVTIVLDWDAGEAPSGTYLGDVSLAEFRDFYGIIPDEAHDQLTDLAHQLASGEVDTGY